MGIPARPLRASRSSLKSARPSLTSDEVCLYPCAKSSMGASQSGGRSFPADGAAVAAMALAGPRLKRPRLKILALHGSHSEPECFRHDQLGAIVAATQGFASFHIPRAPHKVAHKGAGGLATGRQWMLEEYYLGSGEHEQTVEHERWMESLDHLIRVIHERGPFDGLVGFSMGAAAASSLLTAFRDPLPFRFVILLNAYAPGAHQVLMRELEIRKPLRIPSLHCFGLNDHVVPGHYAMWLSTFFEASSREFATHDNAHEPPIDPSGVVNFIRRFYDSHDLRPPNLADVGTETSFDGTSSAATSPGAATGGSFLPSAKASNCSTPEKACWRDGDISSPRRSAHASRNLAPSLERANDVTLPSHPQAPTPAPAPAPAPAFALPHAVQVEPTSMQRAALSENSGVSARHSQVS